MVRTRFAPSPTGYLHIGGVRTALFNWLFARRHGGAFILRIDDTDRERNVAEALAPILAGFRWLGIDWDEGAEAGGDHGPYYQSEKVERYREAARELVAKGIAYDDYARPEEIEAERRQAEAEKRRFLYSRRWMAESDADRARFGAEGRQAAVRLKMPREGSCRFTDLVRGEVDFEWAREQDHVILRADGSPLYHLASVVDDRDMAITHVIRAEEHLSNTPRQIFIAQGLGCEPPAFAHLPQVAEPGSKTKLSKRKLDRYLKNPDFAQLHRHGEAIAQAIGHPTAADSFNPVLVDFYQTVGYLPEAILNYLLLLGWSLDDRTEFFSRREMIEQFSLERVQKAPASFDPQKLVAFEERYMRELPLERKVELALPFLVKAGLLPDAPTPADVEYTSRIVAAAGDRIKVAGDVLDYDEFFRPDGDLAYDEKVLDKRLRRPPDAARLLAAFRGRLAGADPFEAAALEELMRRFVEEEGVGLGQVIHAVRVAVTGKGIGFGMFEILEILGRERCLARIDQTLARLDPA